MTSTTASSDNNPLLADWSANNPFAMPPFADIQTSHFQPALEVAMQAHLADLQAIVDDTTTPPTFDSVVAPYDRAGQLLSRVSAVYANLGSSLNTEALQAVQTTMSPILSRHRSKSYTLPGLFEKIRAVYLQSRNDAILGLNAEQIRLVERIHVDVSEC